MLLEIPYDGEDEHNTYKMWRCLNCACGQRIRQYVPKPKPQEEILAMWARSERLIKNIERESKEILEKDETIEDCKDLWEWA